MDTFERLSSSFEYPTPFSNSPSFLWLLLSLLAQKQAPDPSVNFSPIYDYIVVGAGSAGSVVTSRLSECPSISVLLVEAGKVPPVLSGIPFAAKSLIWTDLDWKYRTASQKYTGTATVNRKAHWPKGKVLGGTSILNAMINVRGNRKNYDDWDKMGATGWGYKDVLPYFKKLEDNPELGPSYFHGIRGPLSIMKPKYNPEIKMSFMEASSELGYKFVDINGPSQIGFCDPQCNQRQSQRCSTAKAYLVPAENRENLDIIVNSFVTKILISDNRAYGVQFDRNGTSHVVLARKEVIVSGGTINSAQLLMLSGIGPKEELFKHNISVIKDLPVEKNLHDHTGFHLTFTVNDRFEKLKDKVSDEKNIQRYIQSKSGPLASMLGVSLLAFLPNQGFKAEIPDYQIQLTEGTIEFFKQIGLRPDVYERYYGPYVNKTNYWCTSCLMHPRSKGQITLKSSDPYDHPIMDPNYYADPADVHDVVQGMLTCNRLAKTNAMRRIETKPLETIFPGCENFTHSEYAYLECQAKSMVITFHHQVGTAKMGKESDPTTVVDPKLRVKGIQSLRVVDASVMPTIPTGNLNIPIIMIAEKASDIIREDGQHCNVGTFGRP